MPSWFTELGDGGRLASWLLQGVKIGLLVLAFVLAYRSNKKTRARIGREPEWSDLWRSRDSRPSL